MVHALPRAAFLVLSLVACGTSSTSFREETWLTVYCSPQLFRLVLSMVGGGHRKLRFLATHGGAQFLVLCYYSSSRAFSSLGTTFYRDTSLHSSSPFPSIPRPWAKASPIFPCSFSIEERYGRNRTRPQASANVFSSQLSEGVPIGPKKIPKC